MYNGPSPRTEVSRTPVEAAPRYPLLARLLFREIEIHARVNPIPSPNLLKLYSVSRLLAELGSLPWLPARALVPLAGSRGRVASVPREAPYARHPAVPGRRPLRSRGQPRALERERCGDFSQEACDGAQRIACRRHHPPRSKVRDGQSLASSSPSTARPRSCVGRKTSSSLLPTPALSPSSPTLASPRCYRSTRSRTSFRARSGRLRTVSAPELELGGAAAWRTVLNHRSVS